MLRYPTFFFPSEFDWGGVMCTLSMSITCMHVLYQQQSRTISPIELRFLFCENPPSSEPIHQSNPLPPPLFLPSSPTLPLPFPPHPSPLTQDLLLNSRTFLTLSGRIQVRVFRGLGIECWCRGGEITGLWNHSG